MSKNLVDAATTLAATFMPAEQAQGEAALGAAKSLVLALEAERDPAFQGGIGHRALSELSRGVDLSVQADIALRTAHGSFARILGKSGLTELGWGCTNNECPPVPTEGNIEPFRRVA